MRAGSASNLYGEPGRHPMTDPLTAEEQAAITQIKEMRFYAHGELVPNCVPVRCALTEYPGSGLTVGQLRSRRLNQQPRHGVRCGRHRKWRKRGESIGADCRGSVSGDGLVYFRLCCDDGVWHVSADRPCV